MTRLTAIHIAISAALAGVACITAAYADGVGLCC